MRAILFDLADVIDVDQHLMTRRLTASRRSTAVVLGAGILSALIVIALLIWMHQRLQPRVVRIDEDLALLVGEGGAVSPPGMDALTQGTLANVGGCLGVKYDLSDPGTVVVWPRGTSVVSDDPVRLRFGDQNYGFGDDVALVGGEIEGGLKELEAFASGAPASCLSHPAWAANRR